VLSSRAVPEDDVAAPAVNETERRIPWRVLDLGLLRYGAALERQVAMVEDRIRDRIPDTLILVEHPPVVTLGRAKTTANVRLTPHQLRAQGIEFFEISRGGDATYHAPGQLVGYPIFDLRQHGRDVLQFCRRIEAALIATMTGFGVTAWAIPGKAGVWVGDRKIASLGISLRRWVTFHGFALNVAVDLSGFHVIRPCGEEPEVMSSMEALLTHSVAMEGVRSRVVEEFARVFHFGEWRAVSS
jgi:lipoate-protein ligase B